MRRKNYGANNADADAEVTTPARFPVLVNTAFSA
jgi:hypothetical protein